MSRRARAEIDEIVAGAREGAGGPGPTCASPAAAGAVLGVGVAAVNQLVGVNAVIYYAPTILQDVLGARPAPPRHGGHRRRQRSVTYVALTRIDAWGRRPLLLGGLAVVIVALVALVVLFLLPNRDGFLGILVVVALCVYIAAFAASLGIAIWLVNSEVFPTAVRGKAGGAGCGDPLVAHLVIASRSCAHQPPGESGRSRSSR